MDQERNEVRQVEDARERVARDVQSVAENANVVERTKETVHSKIDETKSAMSERVRGAREKLQNARDTMASSVQGSMENVRANMGNTNPMENPIVMLLGGLAIGFLIGMVLPVTRIESERIGPIAEDMRDKMRQAGSEVVRRGGEVIKETIEAGREAATNSIREQAKGMGIGGSESDSMS